MVLINDNDSLKTEAEAQSVLQKFNNTLVFDQRLFDAAVNVSFVYADALFSAGVLTRLESERIKNGLQTILKRAEYDANYFNGLPFADVHTFIEEKLTQLVGEPARKILTGRTRAEQIATVFKFWLRTEIVEISGLAKKFQKSLVQTGGKHSKVVLPTIKRYEKNNSTLWGHWCLAFYEMISRDRERLDEVWRRVNISPLGAADNAETMLEIDFEGVSRALKFEGLAANNLDAVSDRDFVLEFVGTCAILMTHLSRLATDLLFYSANELKFFKFSDGQALDSYLPDKMNCRAALKNIRGKSGRVYGHQIAILSNENGLSLESDNNLHGNLEAVFDTVDTIKLCLENSTIVLDLIVLSNDSKSENPIGNVVSENIFEALEIAKKHLRFEGN